MFLFVYTYIYFHSILLFSLDIHKKYTIYADERGTAVLHATGNPNVPLGCGRGLIISLQPFNL